MKHNEIVKNLLNKTDKNVPRAMNLVQDIILDIEKDDKKGMIRFFERMVEETEKTDGQDCLIINGVVFDWKECNKPEMLDEFVDMALNSMRTENSRNKLNSLFMK